MRGSEEERLPKQRTMPLFNAQCLISQLFSLSLMFVVIYVGYPNDGIYVQEPNGEDES